MLLATILLAAACTTPDCVRLTTRIELANDVAAFRAIAREIEASHDEELRSWASETLQARLSEWMANDDAARASLIATHDGLLADPAVRRALVDPGTATIHEFTRLVRDRTADVRLRERAAENLLRISNDPATRTALMAVTVDRTDPVAQSIAFLTADLLRLDELPDVVRNASPVLRAEAILKPAASQPDAVAAQVCALATDSNETVAVRRRALEVASIDCITTLIDDGRHDLADIARRLTNSVSARGYDLLMTLEPRLPHLDEVTREKVADWIEIARINREVAPQNFR